VIFCALVRRKAITIREHIRFFFIDELVVALVKRYKLGVRFGAGDINRNTDNVHGNGR
jgi:hypothetical protein